MPGTAGTPGPIGVPGQNGHSPVTPLVVTSTATSLECSAGGTEFRFYDDGDSSKNPDAVSVICNGADASIPDGLFVTRLLMPCGPLSSSYKEILLQMSDGSVIATFSNSISGDHTRLTVLPDGAYQDTDDSGCSFTLRTLNDVRTLDWGTGSESWQDKE